MTDFRTPLQKQLDAKHKRNTLASNKFYNIAWGNGFTIQPSTITDMDIIEAERSNRIKTYMNSIQR